MIWKISQVIFTQVYLLVLAIIHSFFWSITYTCWKKVLWTSKKQINRSTILNSLYFVFYNTKFKWNWTCFLLSRRDCWSSESFFTNTTKNLQKLKFVKIYYVILHFFIWSFYVMIFEKLKIFYIPIPNKTWRIKIQLKQFDFMNLSIVVELVTQIQFKAIND